jgi:GNAT superfamily N-acetyltransferase
MQPNKGFFVHPDFTRQGVGRHIISVRETAAKSNGFSRLELGATLPGLPLYKAMGYVAVERIAAILPDGEVLEIVKMRKGIILE